MNEKEPTAFRPDSPSEYIEKKSENNLKEEQVVNAINNLSDPIGEINYDNSGQESVKSSQLELAIVYESAPQEFTPLEKYKAESFFELTSLELATDKDERLKLKDFIPKDYQVYFSPDVDDFGSYVDLNKKEIVLTGDVSKPRVILELMHEAGHIYESDNDKSQFANEKGLTRKTINKRDLADTLRSERDAWAFAFKKIKPFLSGDKSDNSVLVKEDVKIFAKYLALRSYAMKIEQDSKSRQNLHHMAMDYWDDDDDIYSDYE